MGIRQLGTIDLVISCSQRPHLHDVLFLPRRQGFEYAVELISSTAGIPSFRSRVPSTTPSHLGVSNGQRTSSSLQLAFGHMVSAERPRAHTAPLRAERRRWTFASVVSSTSFQRLFARRQ
ncbi:hypothetical protein EVAR_76743_1 [Eumeta japonica]|uniref:Uncharacterized protein n=1 Tax=Eumeta variegata TaxID=151549 RepID=A0A4C1SVP2_EUMVA|nr:hypothetical protein EVAR_76743_1 [Eumeta japonica]